MAKKIRQQFFPLLCDVVVGFGIRDLGSGRHWENVRVLVRDS
jgi:hypothetical protein